MTNRQEAMQRLEALESAVNVRIPELENKVSETAKERDQAQDRLKKYSAFEIALRDIVPGAVAGSVNESVSQDQVRKQLEVILGVPNGGEITLQHVKKVIHIEEIKKELPKVDTTTLTGKIVRLIENGFFDEGKLVKDIEPSLQGFSRIEITRELKGLSEGPSSLFVVTKSADDRNIFTKDPDVEVRKTK